MNRKTSRSTLALAVCALGGLVPAQAGSFEDLVAEILKMKTEPSLHVVVSLAEDHPDRCHLIGHNLGEGAGGSSVLLGRDRTPFGQMGSQWINAQHLLATSRGGVNFKPGDKAQVAVQLEGKSEAPAAPRRSNWLDLPPSRIDSPLELIQSPALERISFREAHDIRASMTGLGSVTIQVEVTQGHVNTLVARAFGLTPAQVAARIRQVETKAAPAAGPIGAAGGIS